jgi:glycosyltransferase involved in cell wall biosynthesis
LNSLAIAVPTYNRDSLLDFFLATHAPYFHKYDVPIYVVDNASDDGTEAVCKNWAAQYANIRKHRFINHVEPDENFHRSLTIPTEDFIWLIGDGYEVSESMLVKVLDILNDETLRVDHITTNLVSLSNEREQQLFFDRTQLVKKLPWLMACISCNIYSRRLISDANFSKFYRSNWLQLGIILDYLERAKTRVLFLPEVSVVTLKCPVFKKSGWGESYFKVCFDRFPTLVFSLGSDYSIDEKLDIVYCFYKNTPLFKFRHLLAIRAQGHLNWQDLTSYLRKIRSFAPLEFHLLIMSLASLPRPLAFVVAKLIDTIRRLNYRVRLRLGIWREGY